jgi:elongation factor G
MAARKTESVRTVAVAGPTGSGKTALVASLTAAAGGGDSRNGDAPGQSVDLAISTIEFMGDRYALVDTPGAVDFCAEMDFVLPAVDLTLVLADPDPDKAGLVMPFLKELERLGVPRAVVVNKIDQAHGRVRDLLEALQPMSATRLVARQIPIWKDEHVAGFVDLALERAFIYQPGKPSERVDIPADLVERKAEARFHMLEQLADFDDALMEQLLSDVTPSQDEVFADLVKETREGLIVPVFFASASQGFGVRRLLKALRHDTPEPGVAAQRIGVAGNGAYAFKISHAGQAGKLAYARVFGGAISDGVEFSLSDGSRGRAGALFSVHNGATKKVSTIGEGDIVAIGKLDPVAAGDILSTGAASPKAKVAPLPRFPVFQQAIATKDRKDDVRLSGALTKLAEEDPGLSILHDQETHEIVLLGQGDPHLRLTLDRLKKRFNVEVTSARPTTPYKETIRKNITQRGRHKKQTGGHGQFGDVVLEVKPLPRGSGFQFEERITGGAVPRTYIPAVEDGVRDAMEKGPLGFPVVDVCAALIDGSYHTVDSSELAFRTAGRIGMSEALAACDPVLLEPIEKLTIYTPTSGTPKINSAVSSRNGQILGFEGREDWQGWDKIEVYLPHAERQDFIIELRSVTQGLATFESTFDHMVEVTGRRAEEILKKARPAA